MISESLAKVLTERFGTRWIRECDYGYHSEYVHGFIPSEGEDGLVVTRVVSRAEYHGPTQGSFQFYPYMGGELAEFSELIFEEDLAEGYKIYERSHITFPRKNAMLWRYEGLWYHRRPEEQLIVRGSRGFAVVHEIIPYEGSLAAVRYCAGCRDPECCDASLHRLNKKGLWG